MNTLHPPISRTQRLRFSGPIRYILPVLLAILTACNASQQTGGGPQKRLKLSVGEIQEISLSRPADTLVQLTGLSDNSEVVDVAPKQLVTTGTGVPKPAAPDQLTFLIKGVTLGTARVIFSEKRTGETGGGQVRKTYLVQVVSK